MKKQELIHIHGLLSQVKEQYEMKKGKRITDNEYDQLETKPTSIHKSKDTHKKAVFALSNALASSIPKDSEQDEIPATAD